MPAENLVDLSGKRFTRLIVVTFAGKINGHRCWNVVCDCGVEKVVRGEALLNGRTQSCGCLQKERTTCDIAGQRFGRLTALEPTTKRDTNGSTIWRFLCDCGTVCEVSIKNVYPNRQGYCTKSCGCLGASQNGLSHSPEYLSWSSMLDRALNHDGNHPTYADVDVCERWRKFENFLADMGTRPPNTTLGRFGDVGNYEPGNCAWQTQREQNETKILKRADLAMAA
jgi:hypothetical protein